MILDPESASARSEAQALLEVLDERDVNVRLQGERVTLDAPPGALDDSLLARLKQAKPALLALLQDHAPRDTGEAPLSLAQHAFFMLDQLDTGNDAVNLFSVRSLHGALDVDALRAAIQDLVRRHSALRTTFHYGGGRAFQRVHGDAELALAYRDLSKLDDDERERQCQQFLDRSSVAPMQLAQLPLARFHLARVADEQWLLLCTLHHIIGDAASLEVLYHDLLAFYGARREGKVAQLPPLTTSYSHWSEQQANALARGELDDQIDYWKLRLANLPPPSKALPTGDRERRSEPCNTEVLALCDADRHLLSELARNSGVTRYTLLLGIMHLALARCTGQYDVPIITYTSGRPQPALAPLVGLFVTGLVSRPPLSGELTLAQWLDAVADTVRQSLSNQDVSIELLEGLLRRRAEHLPLEHLARIGFNYVPATGEREVHAHGLRIAAREAPRKHSVLDMLLVARDREDDLTLVLETRRGAFAPEWPSQFLGLCLQLLRSTAEHHTLAPLLASAPAPDAEIHTANREDQGDADPGLQQLLSRLTRLRGPHLARTGHTPAAPERLPLDADVLARLRVLCSSLGTSAATMAGRLALMLAGVYGGARGPFLVSTQEDGEAPQLLVISEALDDPETEIDELIDLPIAVETRHVPDHEEGLRFHLLLGDQSGERPPSGTDVPERAGCVVLQVEETPQALWLEVRAHADDLADGRFVERWQSLLTQVAAGAGTLGELRLLLPGERGELEGQSAPADHADAPSLGSLSATVPGESSSALEAILAQCQRQPEAVALIDDRGDSLTYAALAQWSLRLARQLAPALETPSPRIGVLLERGVRIPATVLAVWRCACTWVPLSPDDPEAVTAERIERAGCTWVLTEEALASHPALATAGITVRTWEQLAAEPEPPTGVALPSSCATSPAYVLFTSGSSGVPKGVVIGHAALHSFLRAAAERLPIGERDVLLAVTTITFDIALLELMLPLLQGGRVAIAASSCVRDPQRLAQALDRFEVSVMQATPAVWRALLESRWPGRPNLKALCGGEALPWALAQTLATQVGELWNLYGPTEATVWATTYPVHGAGPTPEQPPIVPLGKPLGNTRIAVRDRCGRLLPAGLLGEITIAGAGLADGYLDDAELSAQRFPLMRDADDSHRRHYRTGDLGVVSDAVLYFAGRDDRQVKLRGHRIELGAIEATAMQHPGVGEALCILVHGDTARAHLALLWTALADGDRAALVDYLTARLPTSLVPHRLLQVRALPRLANGKCDLRAAHALLDSPASEIAPAPGERVARPRAAPTANALSAVMGVWRDTLGHGSFNADDNFFDVGGHSLLLLDLQRGLADALGEELEVEALFRLSTPRAIAAHLGPASAVASVATPARGDDAARPHIAVADPTQKIAVTGMALRFPGAGDRATFWRNLAAGKESIQMLDPQALRADGHNPELLALPNYVAAAAPIDGVADFDADFFRYSGREASLMDPQHRLLLELCHQACLDAGHESNTFEGRIGVFLGASHSYYLLSQLLRNQELVGQASPLELTYANDKDYAATRVAYKLNLTGPSLLVGTACSTGLVALHYACESLRRGECDMALVAASRIAIPQARGYLYQPGGILSPDGHCRAFAADAAGTVFGNGVAAFVLRPLPDAVADGDAVYASVLASAVNNDGASKAGYTAPSVQGQSRAIREALARSGVDSTQIGYLEAHGTGTALGDATEVAALAEVFAQRRDDPCYLGAVKSNIGHLDTAAGLAGLAKAVLCLHHRKIPPTLHCERPNPRLGLEAAGLRINTQLLDWSRTDQPLRAGVSAFGVGGTNAHVVLEEAPLPPPRAVHKRPELLLLSASSPPALRDSTEQIADQATSLLTGDASSVRDLAATLANTRSARPHRVAVVAHAPGQVAARLREQTAGPPRPDLPADEGPPSLYWLFPGQGSQHWRMGAGLRAVDPTFARVFDEQLEHASDLIGENLHTLLLGDEPAPQLADTLYAQPALFALEYSLTTLLQARGVTPDACLGHSLGEWVAACICGVLNAQDAMRLIVERARLCRKAPPGLMAVVFDSLAKVRESLPEDCAIAALNGPDCITVAGPPASVRSALVAFERRGVSSTVLGVRHPFHTPLMRETAEQFARLVAETPLTIPTLPCLSGFTGTWMSEDEATNPKYWADQLCQPVRFRDALATLHAAPHASTFLEIGPSQALTALARVGLDTACGDVALACLPNPAARTRDDDDDLHALLTSAGELYRRRHIDTWQPLGNEPVRRVRLPPYPFQRQRHWVESDAQHAAPPSLAGTTDGASASGTLYESSWTRRALAPPASTPLTDQRWLVLADRDGVVADALIAQARAEGVCLVLIGTHDCAASLGSGAQGDGVHWIAERDDTDKAFGDALGAALAALGAMPDAVVHLRSLQGTSGTPSLNDVWRRLTTVGRQLAEISVDGRAPQALLVATDRLFNLLGGEGTVPRQALVLGPVMVWPLEHPPMRSVVVDSPPTADAQTVSRRLLDELRGGLPERQVAYRDASRWVRAYPAWSAPVADSASTSHGDGVVLITGGAGGVGQQLAGHFRRRGHPVVLVGRRPLTELTLAQSAADDPPLVYLQGDVTDPQRMREILEQSQRRFGSIECIVHAAGVADGRLATFLDTAHCERVMAPKVIGADVLCALLPHVGNPRLILFSSITAVEGDVGQSAYCAANAYLDAVAESGQRAGQRIVSVNWDTWRDCGMARDAAVPDAVAAYRAARLRQGLDSDRALEALDQVLASPLDRVICSVLPLAQRLAQTPTLKRSPAAPADPSAVPSPAPGQAEHSQASLQGSLLQLWQTHLNTPGAIALDDDFFSLGGTSLDAVALADTIRLQLGLPLVPHTLLTHRTVRALTAHLLGAGGEDSAQADDHSLVTLRDARPGATEPTLFLIHPVGGEVFWYRELAATLSGHYAVVGVSMATAGATPPPDVEGLARVYARALRTRQTHGPWWIGGASFGGMLAFEIARQLHAEGEQIQQVVLMDTPSGKDIPVTFDTDGDILAYLASALPQAPTQSTESLRGLEGPALYDRFAELAAAAGADGTMVWRSDLLRRYVAAFRHNDRAMRRYVLRPTSEFPMLYLCAEQRRPGYDPATPQDPWVQACPQLQVLTVPGDHFTMHTTPHVQVLARTIAQHIPSGEG